MRLLTLSQAAARLAVSEMTIRRFISRGILRAVNTCAGAKHKRWAVSETALEAFELARMSEATAPTKIRRRKHNTEGVAQVY